MERAWRANVVYPFFTGLFLLLYFFTPLGGFVSLIFVVCVYLILQKYLPKAKEEAIIDEGKTRRRQEALRTAKIYLAPYKSIWKDLKLVNKYCYLQLGTDGIMITAKELQKPYRQFYIITSPVHDWQDLWDMLCISFNHNTSYDGLVDMCMRFKASIKEDMPPQPKTEQKAVPIAAKVDINNASEVELTALPGISIVMSKKLIKKREEIGGFKNVDDVFLFLRLKEHMQNQLKDLICVNKMRGYTKIERSEERTVDL